MGPLAWEGDRLYRSSPGRPLTCPPRRKPCAKLSRLLYVASDGSVHPCAEEPAGSPGIGRIGRDGITSLWTGTGMGTLRSAHAAGRWPEADPPCASCREWAWV